MRPLEVGAAPDRSCRLPKSLFQLPRLVPGALGNNQSRIVTRFSSEVGVGKGWPGSSLCFYVPKWGAVATANWGPPAAGPSGKGCLGGRRWGSRERVAGFVTTPSL